MIGRDTGRRQTSSSKERGLEQTFPSQASKEPTQLIPWFQSYETLSREPARPSQISDLQNWVISGFCFKLLNWGYFVMQQQKTNTTRNNPNIYQMTHWTSMMIWIWNKVLQFVICWYPNHWASIHIKTTIVCPGLLSSFFSNNKNSYHYSLKIEQNLYSNNSQFTNNMTEIWRNIYYSYFLRREIPFSPQIDPY